MLRFLSIQRLAIIDSLAIEFAPGFNVLTGETGAGKSIVVGAIELLLGTRATADLVRAGADTAVVQAVIEIEENKELIVRREVSSSGRSRAFVDDSLVTAATLRQVTAPLIDLHGQHDHQQLLDPAEHLLLLDAFAGCSAERERYGRGVGRSHGCGAGAVGADHGRARAHGSAGDGAIPVGGNLPRLARRQTKTT